MYDISYTKLIQDHFNTAHTRAEQVQNALVILKEIEPYTASHSHRVGMIAKEIAHELKLSEDQIAMTSAAGMLHDIGKSNVSRSALLKPSALSEEEFNEIKKHPKLGADLLQSSPLLLELLPGVLYHHERFDGAGYPFGLSGDQIPLVARIIAIADAYDAMTSDRVYRSALSHEAALHELKRCSGTQFDPKIVDATLNSGLKLQLCSQESRWGHTDL